MQKTVVAPSVATETDLDSKTELFVTTTSATEIEMDRKIRDKPRLKQASRAWYENLTKFFDWKRLQERGSKSGIMITQFYDNVLEYIYFFKGEYLAADKSSFY